MSSRVLMMVLIPYWDDRSSVTHCTLLMSFLFSPLLSLSSEELGVKLFAPLQYRCYHAQAHRSQQTSSQRAPTHPPSTTICRFECSIPGMRAPPHPLRREKGCSPRIIAVTAGISQAKEDAQQQFCCALATACWNGRGQKLQGLKGFIEQNEAQRDS